VVSGFQDFRVAMLHLIWLPGGWSGNFFLFLAGRRCAIGTDFCRFFGGRSGHPGQGFDLRAPHSGRNGHRAKTRSKKNQNFLHFSFEYINCAYLYRHQLPCLP
jgi:hypothetical protein